MSNSVWSYIFFNWRNFVDMTSPFKWPTYASCNWGILPAHWKHCKLYPRTNSHLYQTGWKGVMGVKWYCRRPGSYVGRISPWLTRKSWWSPIGTEGEAECNMGLWSIVVGTIVLTKLSYLVASLITMTSWASWCLRSLTPRLFVQYHIQANNKNKTSKLCITGIYRG